MRILDKRHRAWVVIKIVIFLKSKSTNKSKKEKMSHCILFWAHAALYLPKDPGIGPAIGRESGPRNLH
jgi:hypothetical protein